jgi:hypothetical protein
MNTEPLFFMIIVQTLVTSAMIYCFWLVLKKPKDTKKQ